MINQKSIEAVNKSKFGKHFTKPLYNSYCFSRIPNTILNLFGCDTNEYLPHDALPNTNHINRVVFLLVDSFGWNFFNANKGKYPSLKKFIKQGVASKLTSQFPSTTAAHITTTFTGKDVGKHGIYEWFYYEPKLDAIIAPLLFSFAGDKERYTLTKVNAKASDIYPSSTIYQRLSKAGIKTYNFTNSTFLESTFNDYLCSRATENISWDTISEAFSLLTTRLLNEDSKAYFFFYYPGLDKMSHRYGPDSNELKAELDTYFTTLDRLFFNVVEGKLKNTLILLSADHGQTLAPPQDTIYINKIIPKVANYFLKTKAGKPIVPAGSCRDMFLHVKEDKKEELIKILNNKLEGRAEIYKTSDLINQGFFGDDKPSELFMSRVGNIVILPYEDQCVYWYEKDVFEQKHFGHHGGLSKVEMEIPLLALSY